jgi:hypothetical protein
MDVVKKQALVHSSLTRAAESLGDITATVYALYYARCPNGRLLFDDLHPGGRAQLEGTMVQQALYCLMSWFDSPGEIEIVLISTIPHHIETLGVSGEMFTRLITAVCDTITSTIPPHEEHELAVWRELHSDLIGLCEESAKHVRNGLPQGKQFGLVDAH